MLRLRRFRPHQEPTALQALVRLAWRLPLIAILFGVFFGTVFGDGAWSSYVGAYLVSLVIGYTIALAIWGVECFVVPRWFPPRETRTAATSLRVGLLFMVTSIAATFVGFSIAGLIWPEMRLTSMRGVALAGMYAVLFAVLFGAINYAMHFYHQAIEKARAEEELNMARRIQRSFLRETFPDMPGWDVHAVNISSKQVSGDFYDVVPADNGAILLAIADVSGKGVPAALQSALLQASLRTQARSGLSVSAMLGTINTLLHDSITPGQFATFVLARVELGTRRVVYANAGHNHPVVVRRDGATQLLDKGGVPLGILPGAAFQEDAIALAPGDRIVFFTDGISEAADASNAMYGEDRLEAFAHSLPPELSAREVTNRIVADVRRHLNGVEAGDDMTVLVLHALSDA